MIYLGQCSNNKDSTGSCQAMLPYFTEYYGNPSSIYAIAGKSKEAITKGREQIAEMTRSKTGGNLFHSRR